MRPSNRTRILDAAVGVIQRDGVTAVTFDSVAAEAGLTRGGLMYHFRSREELLHAIHEHLAQGWEHSLIEANGGRPAEAVSEQERLVAYARVCAQSASRAELQFLLESSAREDGPSPWDAVLGRWAPLGLVDAGDPENLSRLVARLAADGLWMYESLSGRAIDDEVRAAVVDRLVATINRTSDKEDRGAQPG